MKKKFNIQNIQNFVLKSYYFGLFIPITGLCLTYGRTLISKRILVWFSEERNKKIRKHILKIVGSNFYQNESSVFENPSMAPIWFCWMQGEANLPLIPKMCLASIRKHACKHPVIFITERNCRQYVDIPDNIWNLYNTGKIKQAHFADVYRVSLLAKHGGLWLDATMFLTRDIDESIFEMPFYSIRTLPHGLFVSKCRWAVFCLGCGKGNSLMSTVRDLFYRYLANQYVFVDYFMFDQFIGLLYDSIPSLKNMVDGVPYNNVNVHQLNPLLTSEFSNNRYLAITSNTYLFKLNWRSYSDDELLSNPNNYYHYLLKQL